MSEQQSIGNKESKYYNYIYLKKKKTKNAKSKYREKCWKGSQMCKNICDISKIKDINLKKHNKEENARKETKRKINEIHIESKRKEKICFLKIQKRIKRKERERKGKGRKKRKKAKTKKEKEVTG